MANRTVKYILEVDYAGESVTLKAQKDLREVDDASKKASRGLKEAGESASHAQQGMNLLKGAAGALGLALGAQGLASAARAAYDALHEGAGLDAAKQKFDNLAESIGTTGDALQTALVDATGGMLSNAELISGATDLMALGLAKNSDEAVRLSTLVGKLGWDMQVLGLTIANQSTARLDSLGLSMETVKAKAKELEAQGYSTAEAFKLAVIESGEANLRLYGDTAETTAGKLAKVEATLKNVGDAAKVALAEGLAPHLDEIAESAERMGPALVQVAGLIGAIAGYADDIEKMNAFFQLVMGGSSVGRVALEQQAAIEQAQRIVEFRERNARHLREEIQLQREQRNVASQMSASRQELQQRHAAAHAERIAAARENSDIIEQMIGGYYRMGESGARANQRIREETGYTKYELAQMGYDSVEAFEAAMGEMERIARERARAIARESGAAFDAALNAPEDRTQAQAMYENAVAAGAHATALADLRVQLGLSSEAEAQAISNAAALETRQKSLAEHLAAGNITVEQYVAGVENFARALEQGSTAAESVPQRVADAKVAMDEFSNGSYSVEVDDTSLGDIPGHVVAAKDELQELTGQTYRVNVESNIGEVLAAKYAYEATGYGYSSYSAALDQQIDYRPPSTRVVVELDDESKQGVEDDIATLTADQTVLLGLDPTLFDSSMTVVTATMSEFVTADHKATVTVENTQALGAIGAVASAADELIREERRLTINVDFTGDVALLEELRIAGALN